MAASGVRQAHEIPLPQSPAQPKAHKSASSRKAKGKAKEQSAAAPKRRVPPPAAQPSSSPSWDWASLTDSLVSSVPPIFTKDGSHFFSLVGSSVRIYAATTGKVVSTLSIPRPAGYDDASDTVTCAVLNPHNAFQLITGSSAGSLAVWDFLEATLLQIIDISQPIHHICAHENFKDSVFVSVSRPGKKGGGEHGIVLQVSLKPAEVASQSTAQKSSQITPVGKMRQPVGLTFSPNGAWLVGISGHKAYVASSAALSSGFTKYVSPERLTCLAFHPTEEYFATGDEKGCIRLWYCLNDEQVHKPVGVEKKSQTAIMHWHAHAVSSVAFTPNGAYLLSGGEESVLVIWQLHTGKREFVPRVGSPIKTISVCTMTGGEEEYLLGLADATYTFIGAASLKISRSYSRLKLDPTAIHNAPSTSRNSQTPLSVHTLTSTLILPSSHPSSLQIYSPISSTLISELEVSPSNRVSRRDEKPLEPCRVEQAILSPSGDWLATIDAREGDEDLHGESYLKIWWWDRKAGFWILNTRVDRPHGLQKVTDVAFSPGSEGHPLFLATAGGDGNAKTWRLHVAKDAEDFWVARSSFNFQNEIPSHVSWSPDGSLLAVTLPHRTVLFDPSTNLVRHTLASPECGDFKASHFIGKAGRYLAVAGPVDLVLWDLVDQRVRWHHKSPGPIRALVSHPREDTFAVVSSVGERVKSRIALFSVNSVKAIKALTVPLNFRNVAWYPLVPSTFSLVAITHDWRLVVLGDNVSVAKDDGAVSRAMMTDSAPQRRTLFQDIFGKSAFGEQPSGSRSDLPASTARPWTGHDASQVFDKAAYQMPPLEDLFDSLMAGFLKPREIEVLPESLETEDVEMADDSEPALLASAGGSRQVDEAEMGAMVDLFKSHTLKAKATQPVPSRKNGVTNGAANGKTPHSHSTPVRQNQIAVKKDVLVPAVADTPSIPMVNGKKRKKSMG
ncbi:WD40 repeat-like protein [Roridomyces roridus]|uniref:WD40 repeat-like protein n=1 Tax=Roridomyces roridus TaxID=1738132 RepID=A0AAD7BVZ0_9AGAR|nr:WD40 repeat-like protein [Roridomyces roridus]